MLGQECFAADGLAGFMTTEVGGDNLAQPGVGIGRMKTPVGSVEDMVD